MGRGRSAYRDPAPAAAPFLSCLPTARCLPAPSLCLPPPPHASPLRPLCPAQLPYVDSGYEDEELANDPLGLKQVRLHLPALCSSCPVQRRKVAGHLAACVVLGSAPCRCVRPPPGVPRCRRLARPLGGARRRRRRSRARRARSEAPSCTLRAARHASVVALLHGRMLHFHQPNDSCGPSLHSPHFSCPVLASLFYCTSSPWIYLAPGRCLPVFDAAIY